MRRITLAGLALLLGWVWAAPALAAPPKFRINGEVSLRYDDNLTNAQAEGDQAGSHSLLATGHLNYKHRLNRSTVLQLRGTVAGQDVHEFDGLSHVAGTAQARLSYRPGRGLYDPTAAVTLSTTVQEFDSDIRDNTTTRLMVMASQRLSTRIAGRVLALTEFQEADSEVFDTRSQSVGFDVDFGFRRTLAFYGGYRFRFGDIVSTAQPTLGIVRWAQAIEPDEVFGGAANNRFAYRLESTGHIVTLGLNRSLTRRIALDLQTRYARIDGQGSNEYRRWTTTAGLLVRF